ncbi:sulfotransferase [Mycobacterium sp. THU-M104]|uniref:sulfotransferase n=1 Tax=Mycobacterium sp. THU-M104 TaxID=3410515 RepID=UPI003B9A282B
MIAGLPRTGTTHLHNVLAAAPTFRTSAVLGEHRTVPPAVRSRCGAGSAARPDGCRRGADQHRDAAFRTHARDDHRPRARRDPAAGQRLLDDVVRDARRGAALARVLPDPRPDPALPVSGGIWPPSCGRCSSCAAGGAGCSSRRSTSSRCRCWTGSFPTASWCSPTATRFCCR